MPDDSISPRPQQTAPVGWEPELAELRARIALAKEMGGADRVARQHHGGRLTVRERIDRMLDAGSFHEIGAIAGKADVRRGQPRDHRLHAGQLRVRPRHASTAARWWSPATTSRVRGGSADASIKGKPKMSEQIAAEFRMPIIRLIEGSGGGGSVKTIETTGPRQPAGRAVGDHIVRPGGEQHGRRCRWWRWAWARWPASARRGWRPATIR